jgi:ribosomal RNA-processing protein 7
MDTGAYLKEAFARYGEVEEVRVKDEPDDDAAASYSSKCAIGFLVFRTSTGLKAVLSASGDASRLSPPSSDVLLPGYKPSKRQRKKQQQQQQQQQQQAGGEEDKASIAAAAEEEVQQLMRRFRARLPQAKVLQEEVDSFMASFEAAEAEEERKRKEAATQPDADGFVTVSYGKKRRRGGGGGGAGKEEANGGKKRGRSGSHKKKKKETELKNFYAHQMREAKREQLARLRTRFEEDKARIERMKAARKFKPFG